MKCVVCHNRVISYGRDICEICYSYHCDVTPTKEQIELTEELKKNQKPTIQPDNEFLAYLDKIKKEMRE